MFLSTASSMAGTTESELIDAITIPSAPAAIAFSKIVTCSSISVYDGGPAVTTTISPLLSSAAACAPNSTVCQ